MTKEELLEVIKMFHCRVCSSAMTMDTFGSNDELVRWCKKTGVNCFYYDRLMLYIFVMPDVVRIV